MARPSKITKMLEELPEEAVEIEVEDKMLVLFKELQDRVALLEKQLEKPSVKSINKIEEFNGEVPSTIESYNGMRMLEEDKINSMRNAIKILPPNMVVNGRHAKENIEAICGFKISDKQMDSAYEGIEH